ncbi:MAG TPA: hypothetical protein VLK84_04125 [Longimicrobium sp.]|nr:hypothetical protein [Longimicrobium sp.]
MRNSTRNVSRGIFGGLVVAGLGFGAGQAFASPELARGMGICSRAEAAVCNGYCRETFGPGWAGVCNSDVTGVDCGCTQLIIDP